MTTIKDIAFRSGCSIRTVSRAFNHPDKVNTDTLKKIREICAKYNYTPSVYARSLKTGKNFTIGVILGPDTCDVNRIRINELTERFNINGYAMLINRANSFEEEKEIAFQFRKRADALLIFTHIREKTDPYYDELQASKYPFILFDPKLREDDENIEEHLDDLSQTRIAYPAVYINRSEGYKESVLHLVERGHQKIKLVVEGENYFQRMRGFKAGLREAGLKEEKDYLFLCKGGFEGGFLAGKAAVAQIRAGKTDALLCQDDKIATGFLQYFYYNGIKVPNDVSVIGYDNDLYSPYTPPSLSTISQYGKEVGTHLYHQLYKKLSENKTIKDKTYKTRLIVRDSS